MQFTKYIDLNGKEHRLTGETFAGFSFHHLDGWSIDYFKMIDLMLFEEGCEQPVKLVDSVKELEEIIGKDDFKELEEELIQDLMEDASDRANEREFEYPTE